MVSQGVRVEIVAKQKGCMLCDLAIGILEEIAPEFAQGVLQWKVVDVGSREGAARHAHLRTICGRTPAVPSIVINERIAFDAIPDMETLSEAVRQAMVPLKPVREMPVLDQQHVMNAGISRDHLDQIAAGIRRKYSEVAKSPEGQFQYPTGRRGLEALGYDSGLIDRLPDEVARCYCGVGNPFSLQNIAEGAHMLDLGCGAGVDAILAAMLVGPGGSVVGVDVVPEMIARAEANLKRAGVDNLNFQIIGGEALPFPAETFDVVMSNGVINLIPDKERSLTEIRRVLKPGGHLLVADQVAASGIQKSMEERLANWFQ